MGMIPFGNSMISGLFPKRKADTDKRDYGSTVLFAGKKGMAGAAILGARAALRTGSGLMTVASVEENRLPVQMSVPEAIFMEREEALESLNRFDAIGIGPGLGASGESEELLEKVLMNSGKSPVIIDADGLNVMAGRKKYLDLLRGKGSGVVLTPHRREAVRLAGKGSEEAGREVLSDRLMEKFGAVVLLKGSGTLISSPTENDIWQNTTGNPGMATAGSGDVLTGIILSLMGQGMKPFDAARAGAFLHGLAGDLAAGELGERSLMAGDIIDYLPRAFRSLDNGPKTFI